MLVATVMECLRCAPEEGGGPEEEEEGRHRLSSAEDIISKTVPTDKVIKKRCDNNTKNCRDEDWKRLSVLWKPIQNTEKYFLDYLRLFMGL